MISINTNSASSAAAYNLSNTNVNLQRSLQKLSSGSRINSSFDDAGGLAVSMKLSASIRRTEATQANVNNALSFLQTQDGVLKSADKVITRLSELAQLSADVTKSDADKALYQTEFSSLTSGLSSMTEELFNDIGLFDTVLSRKDYEASFVNEP
jgi:flagellin